MATAATKGRKQATARSSTSGMICPIWFVGMSGTPPNAQYHYYAQQCPQAYPGATYGMSSSTPLRTGCPGGSCIPAIVKKTRKKKGGSGNIGGTSSHTINHVFRPTGLARQPLGGYVDPDTDIVEQPGRVRVLERRNYLVGVQGRPLAVRLFLTLTSPPNDDPKFPHPDLLYGFGGELDPATDYLFDGSDLLTEAIDPYYVQVYRRQDDVVFHVLTVQEFRPEG